MSRGVNVVAVAILLAAAAAAPTVWQMDRQPDPAVAMLMVGLVLMQAPRIAQQWERAVVLRLGRFVGLRGPGLFWIVPFVDRVVDVDRSADDHHRASPPSRR